MHTEKPKPDRHALARPCACVHSSHTRTAPRISWLVSKTGWRRNRAVTVAQCGYVGRRVCAGNTPYQLYVCFCFRPVLPLIPPPRRPLLPASMLLRLPALALRTDRSRRSLSSCVCVCVCVCSEKMALVIGEQIDSLSQR